MTEDSANKQPEKQPEKQPKMLVIRRRSLVLALISLFVFGALVMGIFSITYFNTKGSNNNGTKAGSDNASFEKIYEVYDNITANYYKKVDSQKLIDGAISGMLDSLDDPYTTYMNQEETKGFKSDISSSFEGIGVEVQMTDKTLTVVSPISGAPAEKAGLKPNDQILEVDGKSIQGKTLSEATNKIRGEKGTRVLLTIQRPGESETRKVSIKRDTIPIETVSTKMLDNKIGHISITSFSSHTHEEVLEGLKKLDKEGMKGLVVDVRQNPGGLLDQAIDIASLFIEDGKPVVSIENRAGQKEVYKADSSKDGDFKVKVPVTVLTDKGSASASEILAGALKESAGATLVGNTTYGKGVMQTAGELDDQSEVKLTTAKWLTPDGNWINKKGIKPDVKVDAPKYANISLYDVTKTYQSGDVSSAVQSIQQMLNVFGADLKQAKGSFDDATVAAVKAFQAEHKLPETGKVGTKTSTVLITELQEKLSSNDTQLKKAQEVTATKVKK
ncbi:S41 family peptidase [Brochothrix thermosphacta]|uniref:S41 family peptidase n=1 Tax=Brochothrix thermosphacta TaxID=2756 RepID=UPI0027123FF3|nr:S41 family peptidase [Brochothrix thermosphacta]MDO7862758.1 S41 family peptidase [Brochothrix thermosphacta]